MGNNQSSADIKKYTCELPDTKKGGYTSIHRHAKAKEKLLTRFDDNIKTLYENWKLGVKRNAAGNCLGTRFKPDGTVGPYIWQTYDQVDEKVKNFGSGLRNLGLQKASIIGIYSLNRPEYVIAEQACYSQSMIFVSLYDTLGADAVTFIINHSGMSTIVATQDKIKGLLNVAKNCPTLKNIIQIEAIGNKDVMQSAQNVGITLNSFDEICSTGAFKPHEAVPPKPDDIASIMYTSGTTGLPKGVVIKHLNAIAASAAAYEMGMGLVTSDIHLSYLPMAHIFERGIQALCFAVGASIGFYQGVVPKLFEDIQELRPTIFASVPRLFNRLYDKVLQTVSETGGMKKTLFTKAFNSKRQQLENGKLPNSPMWDKLVFENLRKKLGGRVRLIITGSAPISNEVYAFLKICFCCPVIQGYGLTETCAAGSVTLVDDTSLGNVGVPVPCNEIRLASVPNMNYFAEDGKGEICIRGPNVFSEYYKDPEKTKEAFDSEGFFMTGDIGKWNENGSLTIIDRKKNIFKLAQGEYVASEYVESVYIKNRFVQQMFVYGDSFQWCLVGIVVPDFEVLIPWAKQNQIPDFENTQALCKNDEVKAKIFADMNGTAKEQKLQGFEMVKAIYLEAEPFSVENGLLTPSFKAMRSALKEKYNTTIDTLYASIPKSQ